MFLKMCRFLVFAFAFSFFQFAFATTFKMVSSEASLAQMSAVRSQLETVHARIEASGFKVKKPQSVTVHGDLDKFSSDYGNVSKSGKLHTSSYTDSWFAYVIPGVPDTEIEAMFLSYPNGETALGFELNSSDTSLEQMITVHKQLSTVLANIKKQGFEVDLPRVITVYGSYDKFSSADSNVSKSGKVHHSYAVSAWFGYVIPGAPDEEIEAMFLTYPK